MRRTMRRSMRRSKKPSKMRSNMRSRVKRLKRSIKRSSKKNPVKDLVETLTLPITEELLEPVKSKKKSKKKKKSKTWSAKLHGKGTKGKKGKKSHKKKHKKKKMKGGAAGAGFNWGPEGTQGADNIMIDTPRQDNAVPYSRFTAYMNANRTRFLSLENTDGSTLYWPDWGNVTSSTFDPEVPPVNGDSVLRIGILKIINDNMFVETFGMGGIPSGDRVQIYRTPAEAEVAAQALEAALAARVEVAGDIGLQTGGGKLDNKAFIECFNRGTSPKTKEKAAACRKEQEEIREALETGGI